jgi:hypothetical protein
MKHKLKEKDDAELAGTLAGILEVSADAVEFIAENWVPRPHPSWTLNGMRRMVTRLREGTLQPEWTAEARERLAAMYEASIHQERIFQILKGELRAFLRRCRAVDAEYDKEAREVEGATLHLYKAAVRESGDQATVREVNRSRRNAGRSRRK